MIDDITRELKYQEAVKASIWKPIEEKTLEEQQIQLIEHKRCFGYRNERGEWVKGNFLYWLKHYARISQAPTLESVGGVIPFAIWPHTFQMANAFMLNNLISILKSRQIGASWEVAAWCLWNAEAYVADKSLLLSKGELEAAELLSKCKSLYDAQPPCFHFALETKSTTRLAFLTNRSVIMALPSTENSGIGFQASRVVCDEHIEHEFASTNYMAIKPTIDSGGGQFISIWTSNENKLSSLAVELFLGGKEGKNGFTSLFFPYTVRPGRSDEWYEATKRSIPESELNGITPEIYMSRNYPKSVEDALSPSKTTAVFNKDVLDSMMGNVEHPVSIPYEGIDSQIVHIYRPHSIGNYYVAASDTSHGVGKDYNVTLILNVKTGAVVADIYNNRISPEELAQHSVRLLNLYQNPSWWPEDNDWGRVTITTAQELGYKNIGQRKSKEGKVQGYGWHTDEGTRTSLWGALIPAINNSQIVIYNKEGLKSLYGIIRLVDKNGRIESMKGKHDDYAMTLGIAFINRDKVQTAPFVSKPIQSLHFNTPMGMNRRSIWQS